METAAGKADMIQYAIIKIRKLSDEGEFLSNRRCKGAYHWTCYWNNKIICKNNGAYLTKKGVLGQIKNLKAMLKVPCEIVWE